MQKRVVRMSLMRKTCEDSGWVDKITWTPSWFSGRTIAESLDSLLTYTTGGGDCRAPLAMTCWDGWGTDPYYGGDCAESEDDLAYEQQSWLQTTVRGPGTFKANGGRSPPYR